MCNGPNLTASDFQNYVSYLNMNWHQCTLTSNHLLYSKRLIQVLVINNDKDIVNVKQKLEIYLKENFKNRCKQDWLAELRERHANSYVIKVFEKLLKLEMLSWHSSTK